MLGLLVSSCQGLRHRVSRQATAFALSVATWLLPLPAVAEEPLPREISINGTAFVLVPEGYFYKTGGIPLGQLPDGGNLKVWLDTFYIGKYEARARDLVGFLNAKAGTTRGEYFGKTESCSVKLGPSGEYYLVEPDKDLPATHFSWTVANELAGWMGFRLPTEAEWEKAARGTDQRLYPWGNDPPDDTYANFNAWSECLVWPVDTMPKGRSPYGAYNMAGNVREFVADWLNAEHDASLQDGARNPVSDKFGTLAPGIARPSKILKGGRWASVAGEIRISARIPTPHDEPFQCNGTRYAIDVAAARTHLKNGSAKIISP